MGGMNESAYNFVSNRCAERTQCRLRTEPHKDGIKIIAPDGTFITTSSVKKAMAAIGFYLAGKNEG